MEIYKSAFLSVPCYGLYIFMKKNSLLKEWHHQDGNILSFWLCSTSQEQLTIIYGEDTNKKILEHKFEAEASTLYLRDQDRLY